MSAYVPDDLQRRLAIGIAVGILIHHEHTGIVHYCIMRGRPGAKKPDDAIKILNDLEERVVFASMAEIKTHRGSLKMHKIMGIILTRAGVLGYAAEGLRILCLGIQDDHASVSLLFPDSMEIAAHYRASIP